MLLTYGFFFVYSSHHNYHNSNASVVFNTVCFLYLLLERLKKKIILKNFSHMEVRKNVKQLFIYLLSESSVSYSIVEMT